MTAHAHENQNIETINHSASSEVGIIPKFGTSPFTGVLGVEIGNLTAGTVQKHGILVTN